MNTLKKTVIAGLCVFTGIGSAFAFNTFEQLAQKQMREYLKERNYDTRVREDDHSLNFLVGENLFWLTFEGDANGMLYTLHRRPIKFDGEKRREAEVKRDCEDALRVVSIINAEQTYKAYLEGTKVNFEFPVYASSASEYQKVFPKVLKTLNSVNMDDFKKEMKQARSTNEELAKRMVGESLGCIVVEQPRKSGPNMVGEKGGVEVEALDVCAVDKNDKVVYPYGEYIYQDKLQFLKPRLKLSALKPGNYNIGIQIITPDDMVMVPEMGERMTMSALVEIGKKAQTIEFDSFGTTEPGFWENAPYKIVIFVDGKEVHSQTVKVL